MNYNKKYRGFIYLHKNKPLVNAKIIEASTNNFGYTNNDGYFELQRVQMNHINDLIVIYDLVNKQKKDTFKLMYSGGLQKIKYIFLEKEIDTVFIGQ
ncbi:hypothetical protein C3B47_04335 [Flavobacterium columnare]|uniref:Carboxypeptidase regulatory-like domain-containing protein n=2 Tax=Flavobacterium columnare TaxID=996 RepID=G8X5Z6_FLACA|nr:hypothetical protein [Flavobacterium columnare]AEW85599.1 hypothetical protein FCOL_03795 [Flavobacterium columnare ATCC 49512]APT21885.1 hypothetical protein BU993_04070 [Flavobacterium columnare]MBF6652131.1 hypothetical protein [Flavobacterium columnare]QOH13341.1 hypothetical protein HUE50_04915 [Flavobacterium columnare]QOH23980.1 hypothetical protein GSQ57_04920 [Flavobacterium columnare]